MLSIPLAQEKKSLAGRTPRSSEDLGRQARGREEDWRLTPLLSSSRAATLEPGVLLFPILRPRSPQVWLQEALSAPNCSGRQREPAFEGGTCCV